MQFFARKIFYCGSLKTSLCCHLEGFDGSGCKRDEKFPLVSEMQGKFGLILYSLGYSSWGQITLLDCSFTWPKEKLVLSPQTVGKGIAWGGVWRFGLLHWPAYAWLPLRRKGLYSLWWKGKLWIPLQIIWFNFLLLFSVIDGVWSCHLNRCSAALQTEDEKAVCFLSGTQQVLARSCSCALLPEHSRIPVMLIPSWREGLRVKGCCLSQEPS